MALPILTTPYYEVTLPILKTKVKFRPFLTKEQKILLMAAESKDKKEIIDSISNLVKSCCTNLPCEPWSLPTIDLETLFIHLRAKSVGEEINTNIVCSNPECKTLVPLSVNCLQIPLVQSPEHTNKIALSPTISVKMKYPSVKDLMDTLGDVDSVNSKDDAAQVINVLQSAIESVYTDSEVFKLVDHTPEEIEAFKNSMSIENLTALAKFFETLPKYKQTFTLKCPKCGKTEVITMESIYDFFTY